MAILLIILKILLIILLAVLGIVLLVLIMPVGGEVSYIDGKLTYKFGRRRRDRMAEKTQKKAEKT